MLFRVVRAAAISGRFGAVPGSIKLLNVSARQCAYALGASLVRLRIAGFLSVQKLRELLVGQPPRFRFQLKNLCQAFSLGPLDFTLRENRTADGFAKKLRRFFE